VQRVDQRTGVAVRMGVAAYPDRGSTADALWDDAGRQLAVAHETGAPIVSAAQVEDSEGAAERLADAVDLRLYGEPGHARAVAELAAQVARQMGLDRAEVAAIRDAAYVRDVGHLGTPDALLLRPGPLSARQRAMVRAHVQRGVDFLSRFPRYRNCLGLVRAHHERPDGTGYPDGLSGKAIPLGAAIIAAADAYRAMLSSRPHRTAYTPEQARAELRAGRGTAWNVEVVDALLVVVQSEARAARARGGVRPAQGAAVV
jgi:HD-GYP domain-containing protein (c-di-GMP phosphodiesterase class II)